MLPDVGIDGEVHIQCDLKLVNVDLSCYIMSWYTLLVPMLFFSMHRLVSLCSYLMRGIIPTSLLVWWNTLLLPFNIGITCC